MANDKLRKEPNEKHWIHEFHVKRIFIIWSATWPRDGSEHGKVPSLEIKASHCIFAPTPPPPALFCVRCSDKEIAFGDFYGFQVMCLCEVQPWLLSRIVMSPLYYFLWGLATCINLIGALRFCPHTQPNKLNFVSIQSNLWWNKHIVILSCSTFPLHIRTMTLIFSHRHLNQLIDINWSFFAEWILLRYNNWFNVLFIFHIHK